MSSGTSTEFVWTREERDRMDNRVARVRLAKLAKTRGYEIDWPSVGAEDLPRLWAAVMEFGRGPEGTTSTRPALASLSRAELDRILEPMDEWRRPKGFQSPAPRVPIDAVESSDAVDRDRVDDRQHDGSEVAGEGVLSAHH